MVYQSILKSLKRFAIPFATVSTASIMFTFNSVKAATLSDIVLQRRGILTHHYGSGLHQEGFTFMDAPKTLYNNLEYLTSKVIDGIDWLNNLPMSIPKLTADLLTAIYHFISKIVLETPLFIFNNPYLKNTSLTFAIISITIVTLLTVFEAFMQMLNKQHTDFKTILKRWFLVASITGFMPFAFETGFEYINKLSDAITHIGGINGGNANGFIYSKPMGFFDTLILILFNLTAISMLIPTCLQAARRWWDLLVLCAISPLALTSWCFDRHKHYFSQWWDNVKSLSLSQLVYAVYILLMGIFIFSTQAIHGGFFTLVIKILIVLAGLNRLSHPVQFVKRMTDNGSDVINEYDKTKKTFTDMYDTLTLKNLRPAQFIRSKVAEHKANKLAKIAQLRKQSGKRFVGDLM